MPGDPISSLTPGAINPAVTQANIKTTICVSGWTSTVRPTSTYTTNLKIEQIPEYGYSDTNLADYEEDHLISLEIGGAPASPANLWPEPYSVDLSDGRSVGARVKDQLENKLHSLVCSGAMLLAEAQAEIANDWVTHWFALDGEAPPPGASGEPIVTAPPTPSPDPTALPTESPTQAPGQMVTVRITSLTSPIARGHTATLHAKTLAGAYCEIDVEYKSGPSTAAGLGPKYASSTGVVSWSWKVGTRTTRGSWPVTVTCSNDDGEDFATKYLMVI